MRETGKSNGNLPVIIEPPELSYMNDDSSLYFDTPMNGTDEEGCYRNVTFTAGDEEGDYDDYDDNYLRPSPSKGSFLSDLRVGSKRASHLIVDVPAAQLKRIKTTEGVSSMDRETKHFSNTTTMHGPKRIYNGKRWATFFWVLIVSTSLILLVWQVVNLLIMYCSKPTVTQVSFTISDGGLRFPRITVCSFNPVKKTYVASLNASGGNDFSDQLLDYLMLYNVDALTLFGRAQESDLKTGDNLYQAYIQRHPWFNADQFFMDAGFQCEDLFQICTFSGRQFACCKYATPVLSDLGKCFTLDLQSSGNSWLQSQNEPGIAAGLQIILDSHLEEEFNSTVDAVAPVFSNGYENGFRFYVHDSQDVPFLSSEGISVSPDSVVYSALAGSRYTLLSTSWGNCTEKWPPGFERPSTYSASTCSMLCKARFFYTTCGCSPTIYNLGNVYPDCTPLQTYDCIRSRMQKINPKGELVTESPSCGECRVECNSLVYHSYNSYGRGLSLGALNYLQTRGNWTIEHMKTNFQVVNVFFRDMSYTEYKQQQGTTLTETLSDIGGNMGLFLGMSVITVIEISLYLSKVAWIGVSRKRRGYMYSKKRNEEEHEKELEEVVTGFKLFRTRKSGASSMSHLREKVRNLPMQRVATSELDASRLAWQNEKDDASRLNRLPQQAEALHKLSRAENASPDISDVQLSIDLKQLKEQLEKGRKTTVVQLLRRRAETAPASTLG